MEAQDEAANKALRHMRVTKFLEFVHYSWGSDDESENEEWAAYKTKHKYKNSDKTGKANLKR